MVVHLSLDHVVAVERSDKQDSVRGAFTWDARVKLALLICALILNVWIALPWLSGGVLLIGVLLLIWSRPDTRRLLWFVLAPFWSSLLIVVGFSIGFGTTPFIHIGHFSLYQEGFILGTRAAVRAYCDVTWLALTFLTTPFAQVLDALRWFRVPVVLVDTLAMMYRYTFLLYEEFIRMRWAAQIRGGRSGYRTEIHSVSRIAAQIFMRAFDRSERIYWAMVARGGETGE